jgi:hypothetical protein
MRLNRYLNEALDLLLEVRIDINDSSINRTGKNQWIFTYKNNRYKFAVEKTRLLGGDNGYNIEWGLILSDETITTNIVGGAKNVIGIFTKVMTCMYMFLDKEDPDNFSMFANVKLARVYDTLYGKFSQSYPFNKYFNKQRRRFTYNNGEELFYYHYSKIDRLTNSQFESLIESIGGIISKEEW